MKRFLKPGFVALAVVAAVTTAFTTTAKRTPAANEQVYNWTKIGAEDPFEGTKSQAEDYYGCRGTTEECAVGTPVNPGVPPVTLYRY